MKENKDYKFNELIVKVEIRYLKDKIEKGKLKKLLKSLKTTMINLQIYAI